MRLKTYTAHTIAEAMELVRREMGPDAIIVSTQPQRGGLGARVTAALDEMPEPRRSSPIEDDDDTDPLADFFVGGRPPEDLARHQPEPIPQPARPRVVSRDARVRHVVPPKIDRERLGRILEFHRIPTPLTKRLERAAAGYESEGDELALAAAIDAEFSFRPLSERLQTSPLVLVGPPGAGKTTACAKMLLRARKVGRPVRAILADRERAGALEQLEAFTRILEVPLIITESPEEAAIAVGNNGGTLDIIDTAGINPFCEESLDRLSTLIDASGAEPILVMPAGGDVVESAEMAERFATLGCRRLLATRLDIVRRLGGVLAAADAGGLAFTDVGISPTIADGLAPLNPVSLSRLLLPEPSTPARSSKKEVKS